MLTSPSTTSFALYRLPYADTYTEVRSERKPEILRCAGDIGSRNGFVVAPFDVHCAATPTVFIPADFVKTMPVDGDRIVAAGMPQSKSAVSSSYEKTFRKFHDAVTSGEYQKLVLSRTREIDFPETDFRRLFLDACRRYPRLMVMLVSAETVGTWLVATPEILLSGDGTWWETMALAGTMPYKDGFQEWGMKNRQEQHLVETYVEDCLSRFSDDIVKDGPFTRRAGNLVHLCTEFRFRLLPGYGIGDVVSVLHPTPAVCGMPKEKARLFIADNENVRRLYYSGFMGPVDINGKTHLYISLRCARINGGKAVLYAGGGIMPDSDVLSEWEETERKMQTIGDVLK